MSDVQTYFTELVGWATSQLEGEEVLLASFTGESSDFVRLNGVKVRQAGTVTQRSVTLKLILGDHQASGTLRLSQQPEIDRPQVASMVRTLREQVAVVPADPFLLYCTNPEMSSHRAVEAELPDAADVMDQLVSVSATEGHDLVGIYAAGTTYRGFANSLGQHNWHEATTFNLDWSQYLQADKAVKSGYAGTHWDEAELTRKLNQSRQQLAVLARKPVDLEPDHYRSFLSPAALIDILDMMAMGGFSLKATRTSQSPLLRMVNEGAKLDPAVSIRETTVDGLAPNFQSDGFRRPDEVTMIESGAYGTPLVSPRSAKEYGEETNGAEAHESPESLVVDPGNLPADEVLSQLDRGLYVGNLWYLNFSDQSACRTTGMTRFATFWVEGGEIVAPANVMRFDDTAFSMLGSNLLGLTTTTETVLDASTYGGRQTNSYRVPGVLVEDMAFTL